MGRAGNLNSLNNLNISGPPIFKLFKFPARTPSQGSTPIFKLFKLYKLFKFFKFRPNLNNLNILGPPIFKISKLFKFGLNLNNLNYLNNLNNLNIGEDPGEGVGPGI